MTATATSSNAPTLARLQALLAALASVIFRPDAGARFETLFAEAEALLARYILEAAIRHSGRSDLCIDDFTARLVWRGAMFDLDIQRKPDALHPFQRIMLHQWRANLQARIRVALARRHRFSRKFHNIIARANARRASRRAASHAARSPFPLLTPSRIAAPP